MKRFLFTLLLVLLVASCGGGGSAGIPSEPDAAETADQLNKTELLIHSPEYANYLVLFVNETLGARLSSSQRLYSTRNEGPNIAAIQQVLDAYPQVTIKPSVDLDPSRLDSYRAELEELSGKSLPDLNSIYYIHVSNPDVAVQLLRGLKDMGGVTRIYPKLRTHGIALIDTPSLVPHQGYLFPESTDGGLNAQAAWAVGVRGQGVTIADGDTGWNFDHEDLPLSSGPSVPHGCQFQETPPLSAECEEEIAHGTAMVGIMAALDNGHGITGMAPDSTILAQKLVSAGVLQLLIADGHVQPGDIFSIIVGLPGPNCAVDGCLPLEADPDDFVAVQYGVQAGITVISGAANGNKDLDDFSNYHSWMIDLSQHDSGSMLVGGSQGANRQLSSYSNYGSPIDVFAWGENVATTGYPAPGGGWLNTTPPLPPVPMDTNAFFMDNLGGTSLATAQIAGAAALIQSYAKQVMGETTRYLMPGIMRQILVDSGVPQVGGGGYIGMQPRIDVAMGMVDTQWATWSTAYPKLLTNTQFTQQEILDSRADGLGIICKPNDPQNSDPCCPDDGIFEPGTEIAEALDFDGDGRADLVQWTRGHFKIDLSSYAGDVDGFGAWDVIINYPIINSDVVWPYVEDINSDGREDLVLYDKEHGTWYISYTTSAMLSGSGFQGWDHIIQTNVNDTREMDPLQSMYCRPHPGDYDGDGYVDLAVACSDGIWYIEYSPGITDPMTSHVVDWPASTSIVYDREVQYLTPADMQGFPGWAFTTSITDFLNRSQADIVFRYPEGHTLAGSVVIKPSPDFAWDELELVSVDFGGSEQILLLDGYVSGIPSISIKRADGRWLRSTPVDFWQTLEEPPPAGIYGGIDCHPVVADFDGDGQTDPTVMCPDEWRIAYSGDAYPQFKNNLPFYRAVDTLTYDTGKFTLPGRSYSGGVSYETTQQILGWYQAYYPNDPPPIPVDMVTISACDLVSGSECQ